MKELQEVGTCPSCECSLIMYKTSNYKRFVKCDVCGISYALPKKGNISNFALECPKTHYPLLVIERPNQHAYFWTDQPCFSCIDYDRCIVLKSLIKEFRELKVYGY